MIDIPLTDIEQFLAEGWENIETVNLSRLIQPGRAGDHDLTAPRGLGALDYRPGAVWPPAFPVSGTNW